MRRGAEQLTRKPSRVSNTVENEWSTGGQLEDLSSVMVKLLDFSSFWQSTLSVYRRSWPVSNWCSSKA